ncbi:MAG: transposase [Planctomycetes bacterium]|nr:transposase [Planctomycetota bacterium]
MPKDRKDRQADASRQSASPILPHGRIHKRSRGKLPHWERDGGTYFVTFRLADSLPAASRDAIEAERLDIVRTAQHLKRELSNSELARLEQFHTGKIEELLHAGHGACHLRDDRCAQIVADSLGHFDDDRYVLHAWCVMPNHVHVVFTVAEGHRLSDILHSWKSFTANTCNKLLGRRGPFWMDESFDRLIRDETEFNRRVRYTLDNPIKAGLHDWKWVAKGPGWPR